MQRAIYKDPKGKMLKVALEQKEGKVVQVKLTGDFFLYPEEGVEKIEQALSGVSLERGDLQSAVARTVAEHKLELFGLTPEGVAEALMMATQSEEGGGK